MDIRAPRATAPTTAAPTTAASTTAAPTTAAPTTAASTTATPTTAAPTTAVYGQVIKDALPRLGTPAALRVGLSPLALRLQGGEPSRGAAAGSVASTLARLLGVDLPGLEGLAAKDLASGHVELRLTLQDAMVLGIPFEGRRLELEVPRTAHGIDLVLRLALGTAPGPDGLPEPVMTGLTMGFEASMLHEGQRLALAPSQYPRITNPSVLQPSTGVMGGVADRAKDVVANLRLRGLSVDATGAVELKGEVVVAGFDQDDLHTLAAPSLPRLETRLLSLARAGLLESSSSGSLPDLTVKGFLGALSTVAWGGSWSASLASRGIAGQPGASLSTSGSLSVNRDLQLQGRVTVGASVAGVGASVDVTADARLRQSEGTITGQVTGHKSGVSSSTAHGVHWNKEGLAIDGVDVDALLPVDLRPHTGPAQAPTVGSAAFRTRMNTLLGDDGQAHHGNTVAFIRHGKDVLNERLAMIDRAGPGCTVLMQTFIFKDDVSGSHLIDALARARARGADVKVLIDTVGSIKDPAHELVHGPVAFQRLRAAGVDVALINDPRASLGAFMGDVSRALATDPALGARLTAAGAPHLARLVADVGAIVDSGVDPAALARDPGRLLTLAGLAMKGRAELPSLSTSSLPSDIVEDLRRIAADHAPELLRGLGRDHRKQLVVYGNDVAGQPMAAVMAGGNNVGDDYLLSPDSPEYEPAGRHAGQPLWNDAELLVRGSSLVASTSKSFATTWNESASATAGGAFVPGAVPVVDAGDDVMLRVVHHQPIATSQTGIGDNHLTNVLLATLEGLSVGDTLVIENPYFIPVPALRDAMVAAARRGARLTVVTNGPNDNNDALMVSQLSRRFALRELVAEPNIAVHETLGSAQPVHRKTVAVHTSTGHTLSVVGSENLDGLSTRINREMFVLGGSALDDRRLPSPDVTTAALLQDAARDTAPGVSRRLGAADFADDSEGALVGDYVLSLLLPFV